MSQPRIRITNASLPAELIQGPKGDKGDPGTNGIDGIDGTNGINGTDGAQGLKGDKGDTGATGAQGPKGDTGESGTASLTYSAYNPNLRATGLTYSSNPASGYYSQAGKLIHFHIQIPFTAITNFGSGTWFVDLPFAPIGDYAFRDGGMHIAGNHYPVMADAEAGTVAMDLWYTGSNGQDLFLNYNSPHVLTTNGKLYVNGTYLIP